MGDKKEGDPTSPATDIYLATCNRCELLLAHSTELTEVSHETATHKSKGHQVWVGLMTVGEMVDWLEVLLVEAGLRD